jgi:hypothetical protein
VRSRLRALGLPRTGVILGLAVTTWIFFRLAQTDRGGAVIGGVMLEVLLLTIVQEGITKRERLIFSFSAIALGFGALIAGTATA